MEVTLDIRDNCRNGVYDEDSTLFPENRRDANQRNIWNAERDRVDTLFKQDCKKKIKQVLHKEITNAQFLVIFDKAWEKGHANGLLEVTYELEDLLETVVEIMDEKSEKILSEVIKLTQQYFTTILADGETIVIQENLTQPQKLTLETLWKLRGIPLTEVK